MKRVLRREDGMALVMSIGFLAVLTTVSVTLFTYSTSTSRSSAYQGSEDISLDVAEAGIARALSKLATVPLATSPTLFPGETHQVPGGSVYVEGLLAGETWIIKATSTVRNPTGSADLHKTVEIQVQIGVDPNGNSAWNYVYSDAPSTRPCMTMSNSVNIEAPLFVRGNLCIEQTARATGSLVKVGGTFQSTNSGSIGTEGPPAVNVPDARVAGGCRTGTSGSFTLPCTSTHRVYANSFSTDVGTLEKPIVDFAYWYEQAKPGPRQTCTSSSGTVPVFDNNTTLDRSRGNVDIMPSTAYTCVVTSGVHTLGKLSWTPDDGDADDFGTLELHGTVFFDGNLDLTANRKAVYTGRGSIYASGTITFGTGRQICGVLMCSVDLWDPEKALIVMVSGFCNDVVTSCDEVDQNGATGFSIGQSAIFQGAVYVVSDFKSTSTAQMQGPVIAHQLDFEQTGVANKWVAIEAMTMGTPGGGRKLNIISSGY